MKTERFTTQACCGQFTVILKCEQMLSVSLVDNLKNLGYRELSAFTKAGILYVENDAIILTGAMHQDKLQLKCKNSQDCQNQIVAVEQQLASI